MFRTIAAATALFAVSTGAAFAAPATAPERLVSPAAPGFIQAFDKANAEQSIREEIPKGETLENWTRMITTQKFTGLATRVSPVQYAGNILNHVPGSCPGAKTSRPTSLTVSGRPAVEFQVDCPSSAGGKPETFILLAIAGASDMHVKQVAWRGGFTPQALGWGRDFLAKVALCGPGATCKR